MIGNGLCNDEANTEDCNYDNGDCCGACKNTDHCTDCLCHEETTLDFSCKKYLAFKSFGKWKYNYSCQIGCESDKTNWIGDGYCDDVTNNVGCLFDGGDCCGTNVNTQYCDNCQCHE